MVVRVNVGALVVLTGVTSVDTHRTTEAIVCRAVKVDPQRRRWNVDVYAFRQDGQTCYVLGTDVEVLEDKCERI